MPVGLRDRRTWRRRGPPARTLVIGTDARYWHQRALSAPTRVVDMSARYIPLAVSTTPSRCRQPPHNVDNARPCRQPPHSVDNARPRPCPENAPVRPRTAARRDYAPRGLGDSLGRRRAPRDASDAPVPGGCPIFCCSGRNETKDAPSCLGIACARPASGERPHAPGLAGPGGRRGRPASGERPHAPGLVPGPASPRLSATPGGTRTRTLIYKHAPRTRERSRPCARPRVS